MIASTKILFLEFWEFFNISQFPKIVSLKSSLLGLKEFLATECPVTTMKNDFYFMLKALLVLQIFPFLSWFFRHVSKRLDKKDKIDFKMYDVTHWAVNNCNIRIANISRNKGYQTIKFRQLIDYMGRNIFH